MSRAPVVDLATQLQRADRASGLRLDVERVDIRPAGAGVVSLVAVGRDGREFVTEWRFAGAKIPGRAEAEYVRCVLNAREPVPIPH